MATRQKRLGHVDEATTMLYTHTVDENYRKVSAEFGRVLSLAFAQPALAKDAPEQLSLQLLEPHALADGL